MIILIRRRKKLKNNRLTDEVTLTSLAGGADSYEKNSRNPYYDSTLPMGANNNNGFIPPEDDESQLGYIVEISRDRLAYIEKLGEGAFGKVIILSIKFYC